jgi:aromatic ring hydroxylase
MVDCAPCTPPENDCYPIENPCTSYAKVYNAMINRAVNGGMTGYRVGEESFQFAHMSMSDLRAMADNLYKMCVACGGCPPPARTFALYIAAINAGFAARPAVVAHDELQRGR